MEGRERERKIWKGVDRERERKRDGIEKGRLRKKGKQHKERKQKRK